MSEAQITPMFPLGMVLMPTMVVPIHVFEPRYRRMVGDCMGGRREFGVVLIERGREVGGGDVRTGAGTMARIIDAQEFPDGRWGLVVGGIRRIQVCRWLDDDPYPRAEARDWPDGRLQNAQAEKVDAGLAPVVSAWRRVRALQSELGAPGPPAGFEVSDDPSTAIWQLAALSPLGPMDRQQILTAADAAQRLEQLAAFLADAEELTRARIQMG
ncbi:MAG: LON peptidase substrate-binding domain-containing protein [bacterium]|nr:LON peptidase substrate-binding domain-containing protein [bacterium]MCY4194048.1 LON peptidase substrate-binding domain-containing protein [bacterium]MCY4273581.1 LON peptidase substrate-binding domain-containing protein [bacterium]